MSDNASNISDNRAGAFRRWASRPFNDIRDGARAEEYAMGNEIRSKAHRVAVEPLQAIYAGRKEEEEAARRDVGDTARKRIVEPIRAIHDERKEQEQMWRETFRGREMTGRNGRRGPQEGTREEGDMELEDDEARQPPKPQTAEERWREEVAKLRRGRYPGREPQYISRLEVEDMERRERAMARQQMELHRHPVHHWREEAREATKPKGRPKVRNVRGTQTTPKKHPAIVPRQRTTPVVDDD